MHILVKSIKSLGLMETGMRNLPIGIQGFDSLRENRYLYVDKTDLVYKLVTTGKPYFFSRPRRFGKSLLISTLGAYFQGRKDLFHGLAIEGMERSGNNTLFFIWI